MNAYRSGASLLELLLVVAIVAILVAIAAGPLVQALRASREGRAIANLKSLADGEAATYASRRRFAIFDELFREGAIGSVFQRGAEGGGRPGSVTETLSDGVYLYSIRFTTSAEGITLDADPRRTYSASYRRFRIRIGRTAAGRGGGENVLLVAPPTVASPPTSAYRPLGAS